MNSTVLEPEVKHEAPACSCSCSCATGAGREHAAPRPAESAPACSCHAPVTLAGTGADADDHDASAWRSHILVPAVLFVAGLAGRGWLTQHSGPVPFIALMAISYLMCGLPVLKNAAAAIGKRDFFNEFTLMGLATLVAFAIGETAEAVGVMLFYAIGEAVQEKAAGQSRLSIASLLASKPDKARLMQDGRVTEVPPDAVPVGSAILVKPGDKIPLDGIVLTGSANVDLSSLTGESLPVAVSPGDTAFSGGICLDGDLTLATTAKASDSMVGKILAMVEHAVAMKSRTERFITVFARYYTPAVVAIALLVAVLPPLLTGAPWHTWIYRALVLLVVSCPCALFLSVPLAYFAGIGAASRHGMLVKGGNVFDALCRVRTVVFDKTGTLTEGKLSLTGVDPAPGVDRNTLLRLAAAAESRSNHPVALAIAAAANDDNNNAAFDPGVTLQDVAGKGIIATSNQGVILAGNAKLLRDHDVIFTETTSADIAAYIALNGTYQGYLTFADTVKTDAAAALRLLKAQGHAARLAMLTGDRQATAAAVASALGLDDFRASLLPGDKVSAFSALSPDGHAAFVGDGVNDAPVLAASGVGIAMGSLGSAAAVEAADAVILDDSLSRLPALFRIARRTRRIAGENIAFALAVKTVIMVLGLLGLSGLWPAVFADVGVALLAVCNSLRVARG